MRARGHSPPLSGSQEKKYLIQNANVHVDNHGHHVAGGASNGPGAGTELIAATM